MGNSWQSPVAGEPSLGTPHYHPSQYSAEVYTNLSPTGNTFYTVTVSGLPAGTTSIFVTGYMYSSTASDEVLWRPYGSSDTYAQSYHRTLGMAPANNTYTNLQGWVTVDSSGRFEVAVAITNDDIHIRGYTFWNC